jgi:hypothetical protein
MGGIVTYNGYIYLFKDEFNYGCLKDTKLVCSLTKEISSIKTLLDISGWSLISPKEVCIWQD